MKKVKPFRILKLNKTKIGATLFTDGTKSPHLIIISSAAGTLQGYYSKFAEYTSGYKEFDAVTFDYEGIGASLKGPLQNVQSNMSSWAREDLKCIIEWASSRYDQIFLVGHSVTGQIFPKAQNHKRIRSCYLVSSQSAANRHWRGLWRLYTLIFWYLIIPSAVYFYKYLPGWAFGSNISLPKNVALEWRKWGTHRDGSRQGDENMIKRFNAVKIPMHFVSFEDDKMLAPSEATHALMHWYRNAITTFQFIRPKDLGLKEVGHFGFFKSSSAKHLWPMPIYYFTQFVNKFD
jgi:predicted alpha/beta hydrolase